MRLDKLTTKSQEALEAAQELAHQHSQQQVDGEHLALALARQQDGIIPTLLQRIGVDLPKLQADLEAELARRAKVQGASTSHLYLSTELKQALDTAQAEATQLGDEYVSTGHRLRCQPAKQPRVAADLLLAARRPRRLCGVQRLSQDRPGVQI